MTQLQELKNLGNRIWGKIRKKLHKVKSVQNSSDNKNNLTKFIDNMKLQEEKQARRRSMRGGHGKNALR